MIVDLEEFEANSAIDCDVAVIGSGAVGIPLALSLARQGLNVLVVEGGGRRLETASQKLYDGHSSGAHLDGLLNGRFRLLGGTTHFWGGQLAKFQENIFGPRPWLGTAGWPIGADDVSRYYDKALDFLGMAPSSDAEVWASVGASPPQTGPNLESLLTRWLKIPNFTSLFGKELSAGSVRVLVHANVVAFESDATKQRMKSAVVKTLTGITAKISAGQFVLACGTIEVNRLLQLPFADGSKPAWHENAWLGKYFMDHLDCTAGDVKPIDKAAFHDAFDNIFYRGLKYQPKLRLSKTAQQAAGLHEIAASFSFHSSHTEHLANFKIAARALLSGQIRSDIWRLPAYAASAWRIMLPLAIRYIRSNRMLNLTDGGISLILFCEQHPNPASRITLADDKDALGVPMVSVNWALDGREIETMASFAEMVRDHLSNTGLAEVHLDPLLIARDPAFLKKVHDGSHQMGGARMASASADGVVDCDLKVFGSDNLYVAGAAVFPTSGFANPTLTAIALGLRLADHLMRTR